jgi:hypothetical protein
MVLALLALALAQDVNGNTNSSTTLPFFDPPSFIVAGVADASNRGGHGSDPILHSTEALVKATALLGGAVNKGDDLETARAYQRAAELDPSESHIFDWGAELLTHRAAEQSIEVFSRGNKLFPRSTRMLLGLAAAFYSRVVRGTRLGDFSSKRPI